MPNDTSILMDHLKQELAGWKKLKADQRMIDYKEWLINNGTLFTKCDEKQSQVLAVGAKCEIKSCYRNSFNIAESTNYEYYEGLVMDPRLSFPINHAFLVKDGVVVDPTLGISLATMKVQARKKCSRAFVKAMKKDPKKFRPMIGNEYIGVKIPLNFIRTVQLKYETYRDNIGLYYQSLGIGGKALNKNMVKK